MGVLHFATVEDAALCAKKLRGGTPAVVLTAINDKEPCVLDNFVETVRAFESADVVMVVTFGRAAAALCRELSESSAPLTVYCIDGSAVNATVGGLLAQCPQHLKLETANHSTVSSYPDQEQRRCPFNELREGWSYWYKPRIIIEALHYLPEVVYSDVDVALIRRIGHISRLQQPPQAFPHASCDLCVRDELHVDEPGRATSDACELLSEFSPEPILPLDLHYQAHLNSGVWHASSAMSVDILEPWMSQEAMCSFASDREGFVDVFKHSPKVRCLNPSYVRGSGVWPSSTVPAQRKCHLVAVHYDMGGMGYKARLMRDVWLGRKQECKPPDSKTYSDALDFMRSFLTDCPA